MAPRKTPATAAVTDIPVPTPTPATIGEETKPVVVAVENIDKFALVIEKLTNFSNEAKELITIVKTLQKESKKTRGRRAPANPDIKRAPSGFAKPTLLSDEMCDFMNIERGSTKARTEVTRFLNEYIKKNELQNSADKRQIHPNEEFRKILNIPVGETSSFFKLQANIKHHFIKTVVPTPVVA